MSSLQSTELFQQQAYINGQWLAAQSNATVPVSNPATGEEIGTIPNMGAAEATQAVEAAYTALQSWKALTAQNRADILLAWHKLVLDHTDELALIMTIEQGKPLAEAKGEVRYAASFIQWFAEEGKRIYGDVIPTVNNQQRFIISKEPVGVVAAITPWNFPIAMITRKAAPALAAGCTVVIKPANETPYCALAIAKLAEKAGIPAGVINIVTGKSQEIGSVFTSHEKVKKLTFTGSTPVGRLLMQQCSSTIKKLALELGGNAPLIVFDDADLDKAVQGAKIACGGKQHALGQTFYEPSVLTNVDRTMEIVQEEIFGPVAPLIRFTDETDVVAQANDTIFGLAAYVYSENISRLWRVSEQLEYGMVGMNATAISNEVVPFGGVKQSGVGREGSKYGLEEFMTIKYMCLGL